MFPGTNCEYDTARALERAGIEASILVVRNLTGQDVAESAAAMAAPALVHLQGGSPEQMADACAMAVKNLLGLVCDPVGGLVEVPCVKRNVIGAMDAFSAAQMALAGIKSRVPPDQVLDAMAEVGRSLPHTLRETGKGGLAATPFGMEYAPKD